MAGKDEYGGPWQGGFIRNGVYWLSRTIAGKHLRISTRCKTLAGARSELERFEIDPAGYVNRDGRRAFGTGRRPRLGQVVDLDRAAQLRDDQLHRTYDLSTESYDALARAQGDRCAICGRHRSELKGGALEVDHCHSSGAVRGLLCGPCNRGIGNLGDSIEILARAIVYLQRAPVVPLEAQDESTPSRLRPTPGQVPDLAGTP